MILTFKRCGPHAVKSGRFYLKTTIITVKTQREFPFFYTQMLLRYRLRSTLPVLLCHVSYLPAATTLLLCVLTVKAIKFQTNRYRATEINPSTPELNLSGQRCLMRFFTEHFGSWTVCFVNIYVKNQQIHQLFIQFINYVWYLRNVSALHCHLQRAFLVPCERCSIE
jgi:hypothetical protein